VLVRRYIAKHHAEVEHHGLNALPKIFSLQLRHPKSSLFSL
jgi:hypothetical protein